MTQPAYRYSTDRSAKPDRSIPMPELGEGAALLLQLSDLQALQTTFGETWLTSAPARCNAIDVGYIAAVIERAGRINGERAPIDLEMHPDIPIAIFAQRALDAVYVAIFGRTFEAELRHRMQASAAAQVSEDGDSIREPAE